MLSLKLTRYFIPAIVLLLFSCKKNELASKTAIHDGNYKASNSSVARSNSTLYRLMPYSTINYNKTVEVAGLSNADSAKIQQWDWLNLSSQKWFAEKTDSNYFLITNSLSGKVLM